MKKFEHLVFFRESCSDASALLQFAEQYAPTVWLSLKRLCNNFVLIFSKISMINQRGKAEQEYSFHPLPYSAVGKVR